MLTRDVGTILVGEETVWEGIIHEIGGISQALRKLNDLIVEKNEKEVLHE